MLSILFIQGENLVPFCGCSYQRVFLLPNSQNVNNTAANQVQKNNDESENPAQCTDDNEEAVVREEC